MDPHEAAHRTSGRILRLPLAWPLELTEAERSQAAVFVDAAEQELLAQGKQTPGSQYFIHSAISPRLARDGTVRCFRYSCSGFALAAYRFVGVNLIDDAHELPRASLDMLCLAYHDWESVLRDPKLRERFGLPGNGD